MRIFSSSQRSVIFLLFQVSSNVKYFYSKESRCKGRTPLMSVIVGTLYVACETNHKYVILSLIFNFISDKVNKYM